MSSQLSSDVFCTQYLSCCAAIAHPSVHLHSENESGEVAEHGPVKTCALRQVG